MLYYFVMIGLNLLVTYIFSTIEKKTKFSNIKPFYRELIIGIVFGICGIIATRTVGMMKVPLSNVRDSFAVTAGLLFGGEAGIVSGLIIGAYRFFSPYLMINGAFTRVSCTVTVLLAGFLSALMRRFFFKNKTPTLVLAFLFSISIEAFHMAMIFLTHSSNLWEAFTVVRTACLKVMASNSISVTLAVFVYRISDLKAFKKLYITSVKKKKGVSNILIFVLTFVLVSSLALVGYFLYYTHTKFSTNTLKYVFKSSVMDVEDKIATYGPNITEEDVVKEFENYIAYLIDDILLIDKKNHYIYNASHLGDEILFPLPPKAKEGELNEVRYAGDEYYFTYVSYGKYYVVPLVMKDDIMFFRDSTVYMVALLNVIIFSVLFFITYILLKTYVISNLRSVIEQTIKAKGEDLDEEDVYPAFFMPMSQELNYTFSLLYKSNSELSNIMKAEHRKSEKFEYLADHDKLTGIYNREGFKKKVKLACCSNKNLALVFIDVDKFKHINDTYGHNIGDQILLRVTKELSINSRSDDILMRYGGDEFGIILLGCTEKEKEMINKKVIGINNSLSVAEDGLPSVSISAGCAFSKKGYTKELLEEADKALYESKNGGRGRCSFSSIVIQ